MQLHPIDENVLVFHVSGERGAHGDLILSVWRYEDLGMRTVQLSFVIAGRGAIDVELTPEGALNFAARLDSHARTIMALNEENR
ncbi:hypothetical protein [Nitrosovibrio sp. Nv4]|uniref:hypothetical protein n=1 Tax=Nitrosovibrio sp. Nv4 TaxID=1945880 RepID=UPI000BCD9D06|nr:hypothetical protein [Nitrosovibrio sp. Nv4]SOD42295.1 hypothetical protein SAMN06298226_2633 [Nitrosovibrio sp. Nv4]